MSAEQAKAAGDAMAALWESEFAATSQVLAAVKDDNRDYRPDPKSRTAWQLATHIATADVWFVDSIKNGRFHFDPVRNQELESSFSSVNDVVDYYQKNFPDKLRALAAMPAAEMTETIDFFNVMQRPRAAWIGFANNHSIHHRGQLAAYLRALGSKVPNIYGPSADAEP